MSESLLDYAINHIFMPPKLPQKDDYTATNEEALCQIVYQAALKYATSQILEPENERVWHFVVEMLDNITQSQAEEGISVDAVGERLINMQAGATLAYLIRAQNAGVIFHKSSDQVVVASFEVSPPAKSVVGAQGKLSCSYPGPAVAVPVHHFENAVFVHELASFLVQMDTDDLDSVATTKKAGSTVVEERETSSPRYITTLLTGILRGIGFPADIVRIRKRIGDDVLWKDARLPWRRSMVWLVIRVAMQLHLSETPHYKLFMVFLLTGMLKDAVDAGLHSDMLSSMRIKIGNRVSSTKLETLIPNALTDKVKQVTTRADDLLHSRWNKVMQRDAQSEPWDFNALLVSEKNDCLLSLPHSREYIQGVLNRAQSVSSFTLYQPDKCLRPLRSIQDFARCSKRVMQEVFAVDPSLALADLETSVQDNMYRWVNEHLLDPATPVILLEILQMYLATARDFYRFQEDYSIMILTLFEIWTAIDAVTVSTYPLLSSYSPEIPLTLFEPLLLQKSSDINRLIDLHQYLSTRHEQALYGSVFTDAVQSNSFAVRFFDSSSELQDLKHRIEDRAHLTREKKRQEYVQKQREYRDKKAQSEAMQCIIEPPSGRTKKHSKGGNCPKCNLIKAAEKLAIEIHEWPLPRNEHAAKMTVFELKCPQTFAIWRDATSLLLRDVCRNPRKNQPKAKPAITLDKYTALSSFYTSISRSIGIASTTKSFLNSHYKRIKISKAQSESQVLVDNGLSYRLYDREANVWIANSFQDVTISPWCRPQFPATSRYASLQPAVESTNYSPNAVIAHQNFCHDSLGLHEFVAFGSFRAGQHLQWLNIAKEIRARTLSFHTEGIYLLLTQSARQIGTISRNGDLEWHVDLRSPIFGYTLLSELENLLNDVKSSWMEVTSVRSIIALCARLLAATEDYGVQLQAFGLMRFARNVTYRWMRYLFEESQSQAVIAKGFGAGAEHSDIHERLGKIYEMALTCYSTYDVDRKHIDKLLMDPEDVAIFVECSIQTFNNAPSSWNDLPEHMQRLLHRKSRIIHCVESYLSSLICSDRRGIDQAITSLWPTYLPNQDVPWTRVPGSERWVHCSTYSTSIRHIHFDILSGGLFIDGKNWNRLPLEITTHMLFKRIFGSHVFEVVPSDISGLEFATRFTFSGYNVHFVLHHEKHLIIQVIHPERREHMELIPSEAFAGDLPEELVHEYVHWLDLDRHELELRPLQAAWTSSSKNWKFALGGLKSLDNWDWKGATSQMIDGQGLCRLVDIHSKSFQMISKQFSRLENDKHIIITRYYAIGTGHSRLDVQLPRFRLKFFVNQAGDLESVNFPGFRVSKVQSIGTLFGLFNRLILEASISTTLPRQRVLIPLGSVNFQRKGAHVNVTINIGPSRNARFYDYHVRADLGFLEGDGSLGSHLYRAYLHALTSHCLRDPLTGRTGIEESLCILRSSRSLSVQNLHDDGFSYLLYIQSLSPGRAFYPEHLKVMQTVHWNDNLPIWTQHPLFVLETSSILNYYRVLQKLQGESGMPSFLQYPIPQTAINLVIRDIQRNSPFYVGLDVQSNWSSPLPDTTYLARDAELERELVVCEVASSIFQPRSDRGSASRSQSLPDVLDVCDPLYGSGNGKLSLSYSLEWLDEAVPISYWPSLYELCCETLVSSLNKSYQLLFSFTAMAYSHPNNQRCRHLISILLQIIHHPDFFKWQVPRPPPSSLYRLRDGFKPVLQRLRIQEILESAISKDTRRPNEKEKDFEQRQNDCRSSIQGIINFYLSLWPTLPSTTSGFRFALFPIHAFNDINELYRSCYQNCEVSAHIEAVQVRLDHISSHDARTYPEHGCHLYKFEHATFHTSPSIKLLCSGIDQLLLRTPPDLEDFHFRSLNNLLDSSNPPQALSKAIQSMILQLSSSSHEIKQLFGKELKDSCSALMLLRTSSNPKVLGNIEKTIPLLSGYAILSHRAFRQTWSAVCDVLSPRTELEKILSKSGLWPSLTPYSLLKFLAHDQRVHLNQPWKRVLNLLGKRLVEYQRSQRLLFYACQKDIDSLLKEIMNNSTQGLEDPDWLLVQISSNFLARDIQISFAKEMINPSNSANAVLQLNMGEGKSSVIVPLIASSLPDGQKLVRVVVLKALSAQMFQLLVDRVSGMPNRRIFYLPFSRDHKINSELLTAIQSLYRECMESGGILLTQPEHLLSFRLMGVEQILNSGLGLKRTESSLWQPQLVESHRWLCQHSRDILDESDEILHVRYRLIYTIGKQALLEDHPNRWTTVQEILGLVFKHAPQIKSEYPRGIHLQNHHAVAQSVPIITILQEDALDSLIRMVVTDILNGALSNYPFERLPTVFKDIAERFVMNKTISHSETARLAEFFSGSSLWNGMLLIRGLIAHGILAHCLQRRRWRVDYGLDPSRTLLAVPYRAKDVPAPRSDFSHPDVAICLTSLSYYYGGLTANQVEDSLQFLLKSDNPSREYEKWIVGVENVPRTVTAINLKDQAQLSNFLVPQFSHNRSVINFYLSQVVFPKYAMEFPEKLMTSGWDLTEAKNLVTGFSGTKDSQHLLPTTITQCDPLGQESTNAQVIEYLLQPENVYLCVHGPTNQRLSAAEFLSLTVDQVPKIRVLLDVGAQILDLDNEGVARLWLELNEEVAAAVFLNQDDHMMVVDRQGDLERLGSSQYRNQLGNCVVYLDDAHTRGTDLKLPRDYRAAVTLGDKVTKDRLLQGCMRMRQLGRGQSVMFLASAEIDQKIRKICNLDEDIRISSSDVLKWTYSETVMDVEHYIPNWVDQGLDYIQRKRAWDQFCASRSVAHLAPWKQPEARTLEQMYGVAARDYEEVPNIEAEEYRDLRERCQKLGWDISRRAINAGADEEQEREVSAEIEKEQQVEKPLQKVPENHKLRLLSAFFQTGIVPKDSPSFIPLFQHLDIPTIRNRQAWSRGLLSSLDFATTIRNTRPSIDEDMRPVTWVVSGGFLHDRTPVLVVISPVEADEYRSTIATNKAGLYLHVYAAKVTQNQASFEDLRFLTIPPLTSNWNPPDSFMIMQLNIFAGQLYLCNWDTYKQLCLFLGLHLAGEEGLDSEEYESDGFIKPEHRSREMKLMCPFENSPLPELKRLFGARRKGSGYAFTHMGKIIAGRSLERKDFA
ncbi:hypothetical protein K435DRAFT_961925 [Dendrothele bispora CBS 962.96]|uniref:ubiquitinyl hydrolase 1 n=1 Tax=Dendrothele bispora (strain CBS 962.96) TaxID=1314807 RepID=A0A4S8MMX9_DENBC|nr:hypothetical protein K435DRAFT_961925 [Dendrothele bispora CBS 962.96]